MSPIPNLGWLRLDTSVVVEVSEKEGAVLSVPEHTEQRNESLKSDTPIVSPVCLVTAGCLLFVAMYLQAERRRVTLFNTVLLIAAIVSVVHHSRLSKWIINDWIRWADILLWATTISVGFIDVENKIAWASGMLGAGMIIMLFSWSASRLAPYWHMTAHVVACITLLAYGRRRSEGLATSP